jgi:hypothetical protein
MRRRKRAVGQAVHTVLTFRRRRASPPTAGPVTNSTGAVYDHQAVECDGYNVLGLCTGYHTVYYNRVDPAVATCPAGKVALFGWTADGAVGSRR